MFGYLNLFSLILGIIAWILPVISIMRYKKHNNRNWATLSLFSISACAISLCFQIFYYNYLVSIGDWSALMDISGAVASAASVLLIVTLILNAITLIIYRAKSSSG